ncbi:MAG: hypothetical protein K2F59_03685 [Eubacteriales bacterium]|nr:hypothetical protein [Eubacteriales bacterium]
MKNKELNNLSSIKLEIIQCISKCEDTKENEKLLFKMAGYIECLADKSS